MQTVPVKARVRVGAFVMLALSCAVAACGGNDSNNDGNGAAVATTTTVAAATAAASFKCPVSRQDVETEYSRVAFADSTTTGRTCTFMLFDESGSLIIGIDPGGAARFATTKASFADAEAVADVGDEAVYSEGRTTLIARRGDDVLVLQNIAVVGFGGGPNVGDQTAARRIASIAVAKKALAAS